MLFDLLNVIPDRTNPDFQRIAASFVTVPDDVSRSDFFRCVQCYDVEDSPVDGAAVAERLREEVNPAYESLGAIFGRLPYITRLYTTLSADEMNLDPIFSVNPDMEDVSNIHVAEADVSCDDNGEITVEVITLEDGRTYNAADATPTQRQEGETVRGEDLPAAAVIEQTFEAGQPEVMMSMPDDMMTPSMGGAEGGDDDDMMNNEEDDGDDGERDDAADEGVALAPRRRRLVHAGGVVESVRAAALGLVVVDVEQLHAGLAALVLGEPHHGVARAHTCSEANTLK